MKKRRKRRRRRVHPKRRGKRQGRGIKRLLILFLVCWGTWNLLSFMYRNLYGVVMNFASNQAVNIATAAISEGVLRSEMSQRTPTDFITFSEVGNNPLVNDMLINSYTAVISQEIVDIMQQIQQGNLSALGIDSFNQNGVIFEVPWAAAFNLTLFHDVGPKIPVRAQMMGNVDTDLSIQIEPFGINNAVLRINLIITTNIQVALPFRSQIEPIQTTIGMFSTILQGDIPHFYWNSSDGATSSPPPVVLPSVN